MPFFPSSEKNIGKVSELPQFIRDQRHRRGGQLAVETGFPTSIVDLVVKNRQSFKKSSKKMEQAQSSSLIVEPPTLPPLPRPPSPATLLNTMAVVEGRDGAAVVEGVKEGENHKGFLMLLRASLLVALALGTKQFAVGLTVAAFLLILLECVGKPCFGLLMPCAKSKKDLRLILRRALRFMRIREEKLERKGVVVKEGMKSVCSDFKNLTLSSSVQEIEIVESKSLLVDPMGDIQCKEEGVESELDKRAELRRSYSLAVLLEEECRCEALEIKNKKALCRAEMKTKLKYIFGGRKSAREKKEGILERDLSESDKNLISCEGKEKDGQENESKLHYESNLSSISSESIEDSISGVVLEEQITDGVVVGESERIQNSASSEYLFLCLIVLIGLFEGKMHALMLILLWCALKTSGGKLGRYLIMPGIRHF